MSILSLSLVGASVLSVAAAQGTLSFQLTNSPPSGASDIIDPSFAGFGIEPSNLFSFTGQSSPNQLSINLLENLASYTGTPPHIRIGGNTQDYMVYSESMTQWTYINNPNAKGQGNYASDSMLIGPRFYEAANRLPKGTPITYGLNLAYTESDYISQIVTTATQAITKMTNLNVVSLEIGNEPDLYGQNGFRTGTWDGQTYTQQWLNRAQAVYNQVLKPNGLPSNFFEPGTTASTIGTTFQIQDLVSYGITANANGTSKPYISSWNQHDYYYYIGVSTYPLTLYSFMTLSTTKDQFAAWVSQIKQANATPYPYALREMGVVGPIGMAGITDTFAASLWTLNFLLYASTLNITQVGMHMTDNSNASAWQPIYAYGNAPFVRPNYYAFAAFDQTIGPSCQARVFNYPISDYPSGYGGRLEAYSVYQKDTLSSVVIINSMMSNVSDTDKQSLTVTLDLPTEFAGQTLYLAYLTNDGADAQHGTTWNSLSFENSGDGTPSSVANTGQTVTIGSDGSATVTVRDTQAVVAQIGTPVGSIPANTSACSAFSAKTAGSKSSTAASTTSSSAASSNARTSASSTTSATNGVAGLSTMLLITIVSSIMSGTFLLWT